MTEIYAASETPIPGVSGEGLLQGTRLHGQRQAHFVAEVEGLPAAVLPMLQEGDVLLSLGAGNILQAGELVLAQLNGRA